MPCVINSNDIPANKIPANSVFISVGSKWDRQPASFGDTKEQILEEHKLNLANDEAKLQSLDELTGKDLICYCNAGSCHGDILVELANISFEDRLEWAKNYLGVNVQANQANAA